MRRAMRHAHPEPAHMPDRAEHPRPGQQLYHRRLLPRARGGWALTREVGTSLQLPAATGTV
eukprot:9771434-Alexandrium_andersonii.AAC.1